MEVWMRGKTRIFIAVEKSQIYYILLKVRVPTNH